MTSPEIEQELLNVVRRAWCPVRVFGRRRGSYRAPVDFFQLARTKGVSISEDAAIAFEESFEFRKIGRFGSEAVALAHAATHGHSAASLLLAGASFTRAMDPDVENTRAELARTFGWLQNLDRRRFKQNFGNTAEHLRHSDNQRDYSKKDEVSSFRRMLEWKEGKLTVISKLIQKPRFENADGARYLRLNHPMSFHGPLTEALIQKITATIFYEYPWATELNAELENALSLACGTGARWVKLPPLLVVGPPGNGKSRFARRIAEITNVPFQLINFSGSSDNRDLAGTAKGWGSATPSRICEIFIDTESPNPVVLLDEIDKVSRDSRNGDMLATLLTILASETQTRFRDEALGVDFDLRHVTWIATANSVSGLGRPLLSRFRIVNLPPPPASAAERVLDVGIQEFAAAKQVDPASLPEIQPAVRAALLRALTCGATPRALSNMLADVMAIEMRSIRTRAH